MDEFLAAYGRDFEITGGDVMITFLGLQVDHVNQEIHLRMDNYVEEILREFKEYARKTLRPKKLLMAPNHQLPRMPPLQAHEREPPTTSFFRSFVMKLQFAATWVRFGVCGFRLGDGD